MHYRRPEAPVGGVAWLWWCHVLLKFGGGWCTKQRHQWVVSPGCGGAMFCPDLAHVLPEARSASGWCRLTAVRWWGLAHELQEARSAGGWCRLAAVMPCFARVWRGLAHAWHLWRIIWLGEELLTPLPALSCPQPHTFTPKRMMLWATIRESLYICSKRFSDLLLPHHPKEGHILILFNLNIMFWFCCKSMRFPAVSSVITRRCVQKTGSWLLWAIIIYPWGCNPRILR